MHEALTAQIRECFARVVWTHKVHEKCADILNSYESGIKYLQILLSTLTSSGLIAVLVINKDCLKIATVMISALLTATTLIVKDFSPASTAQKHSQCAIALWNIRESYLTLLVMLKDNQVNIKEVENKRDELQKQQVEIFKSSPRTFRRGYNQASKALKLKEELTFSDKEIDLFLPLELRKIV